MAHRLILTGISICSSEAKCQLFHRRFVPNSQAVCLVRNVMLKYAPRTAYFQQKTDEPAFTAMVVVDPPVVTTPKCITVVRLLNSPLFPLLNRLSFKIENAEKRKKKRVFRIGPDIVDESSAEKKIECALYLDGDKCEDDFMCYEIFKQGGSFALMVQGETYTVVRNSPWIIYMQLPKQPVVGMVLSPTKFESSYMDMGKSSFQWLRSSRKAADLKTDIRHNEEWDEIGDMYCYQVRAEDIGHYLKFSCTPRNSEQCGPNFWDVIPKPVVDKESVYYFQNTHKLMQKLEDSDKFRVVDYNILADMYTKTKEGKEMYSYCPETILDKSYKRSLIIEELVGYYPDIICLQEVEASMYKEFLIPVLEGHKLSGVFCPKSNEKEGTACFYNREKFTLLGSMKYCFGEEITCNPFLSDILNYMKSYEKIYNKFISLPHSLQLAALLSTFKDDHVVIVGNVHLYASADADIIRLFQVMASFSLFEVAKKDMSSALNGNNISFLFCGDFNSTPDTAAHELVINGSVPQKHEVWDSYEGCKVNPIPYSLSIKMASAHGEPEFTHYTQLFKGCLDYIYYQSDTLKVDRVYPLPNEDQLKKHVALPSVNFPSDHIPLIADLQWK